MTEIRKRGFMDRFKRPVPHTFYGQPEDYTPAVKDPEPRDVDRGGPTHPQSLIGNTAAALHNALTGFRNQEAIYQAEVTAKTEALRQVRASIAAVEAALGMIDGDPALTEEERHAMGLDVDREAARALEEALNEPRAEGSGNGLFV